MTKFLADSSPRPAGIQMTDDPYRDFRKNILRTQLTETLHPGDEAEAIPVAVLGDGVLLQKFEDRGSIESQARITITDPYGLNFGGQGEWFDCRYSRDLEQWTPVGSKGLVRRAKAAEDLLIGDESGKFVIPRLKTTDTDEYSEDIEVTAYFKFFRDYTPQRFLIGEEYWIQYIHDSWADSPGSEVLWELGNPTGRWEIMPVGSAFIREAVADGGSGISAGGSALVTVYSNGAKETVDGSDYKVTAYLDWLHQNESISNNTKIFIAWFFADRRWRVISADCESPALAPPGHGDNITASTTQTQADAEQLSYRYNRITTCANDYDSVRLLEAELNEHQVVKNAGDQILRIWPKTDNRIDRWGKNFSVDLPVGETKEFWCVRANTWMTADEYDNAGREWDGTDDYVSLAGASLPSTLFSGDWTMSFEVLAVFDGSDYFAQRGNAGARLYMLRHSNKFAVGTSTGWVYIGNEDMQTGVYTIQHDTSETGFARFKAWLGTTSKSTATTFGSHTDIASSSDDFNLGRRSTGVNYANMKLRGFRIWSGLVSPDDVAIDETDDIELWWPFNDATAASTCKDYSGNSRDGTFNGTTRYVP